MCILDARQIPTVCIGCMHRVNMHSVLIAPLAHLVQNQGAFAREPNVDSRAETATSVFGYLGLLSPAQEHPWTLPVDLACCCVAFLPRASAFVDASCSPQ